MSGKLFENELTHVKVILIAQVFDDKISPDCIFAFNHELMKICKFNSTTKKTVFVMQFVSIHATSFLVIITCSGFNNIYIYIKNSPTTHGFVSG